MTDNRNLNQLIDTALDAITRAEISLGEARGAIEAAKTKIDADRLRFVVNPFEGLADRVARIREEEKAFQERHITIPPTPSPMTARDLLTKLWSRR